MDINEARRIMAVANPPYDNTRDEQKAIRRVMRKFRWNEGTAAIKYDTAKAVCLNADLKKTMLKLAELAEGFNTTSVELVSRYA